MTKPTTLHTIMVEAVHQCIQHVDSGGLPFVGVVVQSGVAVSNFGFNRVYETGDASAHAEVVAMRDAMSRLKCSNLSGTVLLATGEPCGLCYRFAQNCGVDAIYVAVDREEAASWGFDYRSSYALFGITDDMRAQVYRALPVPDRYEPFVRYLEISGGHTSDLE